MITLAKARIRPDSLIYDIGAGTGSIAVEAALLAPAGRVWAIEREPEGIALIKENCVRFGVQNLLPIYGEAPAAMAGLPPADVIFIGGSGGHLAGILEACHWQLVPGGRIVLNAVTLDTLTAAHGFFKQRQDTYRSEVVCIQITKLMTVGSTELFKAYNPVYIVSTTKGCGDER